MILILSQNYSENSTEDVMDWIEYYGHKAIRLNDVDFFNKVSYGVQLENNKSFDFKLCFQENDVQIKDIHVIWYRKWSNSIKSNLDIENKTIESFIGNYLFSEIGHSHQVIFDNLKHIKWIDDFQYVKIDKYNQLKLAIASGILIPNTLISNNKKELIDFYEANNGNIITKSFNEFGHIYYEKKSYATYTNKITHSDIMLMDDFFYPSIFQENIEKDYELRVFHLNGKNKAMVIFSQNDEQTKIDFRRYNFTKQNKTIPFILPNELEHKINVFMQKAKLTSGSIDIIRSIEGKYIFLEVNPQGQFGMVSSPCNYYLEKDFAKFLTDNDHE